MDLTKTLKVTREKAINIRLKQRKKIFRKSKLRTSIRHSNSRI